MDVLGALSFTTTPDVSTDPVLVGTAGSAVVSLSANTTANRPTAGILNRMYYDTTLNRLQYDNGSAWVDAVASITISGTADQVNVAGSNPFTISLSSNPIIPGTERLRSPVGTTAERPTTPVAGDFRFNSTIVRHEGYTGAYWAPFGRVLQAVTGSIAASSGTTTVPYDNTAPTNTEGNQIWTQTFTPISATSRLLISFQITAASSSTASICILSLFANTVNIISTAERAAATAGQPINLSLSCVHSPGSTSAITFSARLGNSNASTSYCNQGSAATLGGAFVSEYIIMELE